MNFSIPEAIAANPNIGQALGLTDANLINVVLRVVQWILGVLPLVAVIFLILGGFQWLTSAGDEERVERAKRTISAAVIGLVIVLLAWAIVEFFVRTTLNVTGNTNK